MQLTRTAIHLLLFAACVSQLSGAPSAAQTLCEKVHNPATQMGERNELGRDLVNGARALDTFAEMRYIRARLRVTDSSEDWRLVVRDLAGHALDTFTAEDFKPDIDRWTRRIPGGFARFDIFRAPGATAPLRILLAEYIAVAAKAERPYYSYQNDLDPQLFPLYSSPAVSLDEQRMGDHVGFISVGFGTILWTCSSVLVAPDILLTNWHCGGFNGLQDRAFWNEQVCRGMIVDFSWDDDGLSTDFGCSEVVLSDKGRDFAFLRIHPLAGATVPRPARLGRSLPADGALRLVHHPEAMQKKLSRCSVEEKARAGWTGEAAVDFAHKCDSEGGSSGAPMFDSHGTVIGLHHHGFAINAKTCQYDDKLNKGVLVGKILERLERWSNDVTEPERGRRAAELLRTVTIE